MAAAAVAAAVAGSILAALPAISIAAPEWKVAVAAASTAESAANTQPAAPTGVTTACATGTEVTVTWDAVSDASTYTLYDSTSSATGPYASYATGVTGTSYTTAALSKSTDYWFEVSATVGTSWTSPDSAAGAERKISSGDKCS